MTTNVDARGLSCPQPVILAANEIKSDSFPIEVVVDTVTARENVKRMAQSKGLNVEIEADGDEFMLRIIK